MQVSVETSEGLQRKLKVEVPSDHIQKKVETRIKELQPKVKIKGFRPGKVPARVIRQQYGESLKFEVLEEVIRDSLTEALKKEDLNPAGMPEIEPKELKSGEPFEFTATFEIFPEFELISLEGIEINKINCEVTSNDIQFSLDRLAKEYAEWKEIDREAKNDDQITIDFVGKIDDVEFEGGKAEKFKLILGSKSMIPGFEESLVGVKKDEDKDISVTFPENYPQKDLAGKNAIFSIHVHEVAVPEYPEINDEFAEKFGIKEGGVDKLKEEIEKSMNTELHKKLTSDTKNTVFEKLLELNKIDIPKSLVTNEIKHLKEMAANQARDKVDPNDLPDILYEEDAKKRVHLGLLVREAIEKFEIKVDDNKVKEKITEMASMYNEPEQIINAYYSNKNVLAEVESMVLEEQVVEKLLESAQVKVETSNYNKVMGIKSDNEADDIETANHEEG